MLVFKKLFKVEYKKVKVLLGQGVGRRNSHQEIISKETHGYMDIADYKIMHDSHFCIVTLNGYVTFTDFVSPLCLPEINNQQYGSVKGTIFGFGYTKEVRNTMESLVNQNKLRERVVGAFEYTLLNSSQCVWEFGNYANGNTDRREWGFKREGVVSWKNVPGYVFIEK